jgi:hypothetical protein
MKNTFYSWNTKKTQTGFKWTVSEITKRNTVNKNGKYADSKVIKEGFRSTRAQSKGIATKWVKHLTANA